MISIIYLIYFIQFALADEYTYVGCYKKSDLENSLTSNGSYIYQSVSYCENSCNNAKVAAITNGDTCYCGNSPSILSKYNKVDDSYCNKPCTGYPYEICGGDEYMSVYASSNSGFTFSSVSSTSSSSLHVSSSINGTTTVSSSQSSQVSNTIDTSSKSSGKTHLPTQIITTSISVTTLNNQKSTIYIVTTASSGSDTTPNSKDISGHSKSLSNGSIAGIVVGVVVGTVVIAVIVILLWRRYNESDGLDLEQTKQYQPYSFGDTDGAVLPEIPSYSNRFSSSTGKYLDSNSKRNTNTSIGNVNNNTSSNDTVLADSNVFMNFSNDDEVVGKLRLSTGSLPDITQQRPLRIVNPDNDTIE